MLPANEYLEFHSPDDARVVGTRVGIEHIVHPYHQGLTAEEIALQYPTVTLEQVYGVLAYYLRNKAGVDQYIEAWKNRSEDGWRRQNEAPVPDVVLRLRQIAAARALR